MNQVIIMLSHGPHLIVFVVRETTTAWNVSKYRVFSGPYFPAFWLNSERYEVSLRIQCECGKMRTRKTSVFGHFSRSVPISTEHLWNCYSWIFFIHIYHIDLCEFSCQYSFVLNDKGESKRIFAMSITEKLTKYKKR